MLASGIGYGICQRLLLQLSQSNPPDAHPQYHLSPKIKRADLHENNTIYPCPGLTLIMACRSMKKAEEARTKLLRLLDDEIAKRKRRSNYDGHAETFKRNLRIEIQYLDLSKISSILNFGDEINRKYATPFDSVLSHRPDILPCNSSYPYVSHLICNAGVVNLVGIDWLQAVKEVLTSPVTAVTAPSFYRQAVGQLSDDGLGWVWQCNVFGHYVLVGISICWL